MKRFACIVFITAMVCSPCLAGAMSQEAFDQEAIPMLSKPAQASKLLSLCEKALKDAPDKDFEAYVRVVKSHAHLLQKEYDKAEAEAQRVIDSGRQPDLAYTAMMEVLFTRDKYDEGRNVCLERARKIDDKQRRALAENDCETITAQQKITKPEQKAERKPEPKNDGAKAQSDRSAPPKSDGDMSYSLSDQSASPAQSSDSRDASVADQKDGGKNDPS